MKHAHNYYVFLLGYPMYRYLIGHILNIPPSHLEVLGVWGWGA